MTLREDYTDQLGILAVQKKPEESLEEARGSMCRRWGSTDAAASHAFLDIDLYSQRGHNFAL